jgi:hypothetical protein
MSSILNHVTLMRASNDESKDVEEPVGVFVYGAKLGSSFSGGNPKLCFEEGSKRALLSLLSADDALLERFLALRPTIAGTADLPSSKNPNGLAAMLKDKRAWLKVELSSAKCFFVLRNREDFSREICLSIAKTKAVAWWAETTSGGEEISEVPTSEQKRFAVSLVTGPWSIVKERCGTFVAVWRCVNLEVKRMSEIVLGDFAFRLKCAISDAAQKFNKRVRPLVILFLNRGTQFRKSTHFLTEVTYVGDVQKVLLSEFASSFEENGRGEAVATCPVLLFACDLESQFEYGMMVVANAINCTFGRGVFSDAKEHFGHGLATVAAQTESFKRLTDLMDKFGSVVVNEAAGTSEDAFVALFKGKKTRALARDFYRHKVLEKVEDDDSEVNERRNPKAVVTESGVLNLEACMVISCKWKDCFRDRPTLKEVFQQIKSDIGRVTILSMQGSTLGDGEDIADIQWVVGNLPNLELIDLSKLMVSGIEGQRLVLYVVQTRKIYLDLFDAPPFMVVMWEIIPKLTVEELSRVRWLSPAWLKSPAAESRLPMFGRDKEKIIRDTHARSPPIKNVHI